jgi:hypothetical protein
MKLQHWARAAFWLATLAILVLTLTPGQHLPRDPFNLWDKTHHALAFAVLAVLGLLAWPQPALRWRLSAGLVALGGAIEVAQHLTGWRHGEWADWAADAVGVALVALLAWVWRARHSR